MDNADDKVRALMADLILALPGFTPLETPLESSAGAMRFALASMYKEKAYRDYLAKSIRSNVANYQAVRDLYGLGVQQGRVEVLKELLSLSKQMFDESMKIDKSLEANLDK